MNKKAYLKGYLKGVGLSKKAGIPPTVFRLFATRLADKFMDISTMLREMQSYIRDE